MIYGFVVIIRLQITNSAFVKWRYMESNKSEDLL